MSRLLAALCLGVWLANAGLPLVAGLLEPPAALCGAGGRCCCAGPPSPGGDGRVCLRRACGCGRAEDATLPALQRTPALLPVVGALPTPGRSSGRPRSVSASPLELAREPSVPPPRACVPA